MKNQITFVTMAAAAVMAMSCQKEPVSGPETVTDSDMAPHVRFTQNNIAFIPLDVPAGLHGFPLESDVSVCTASFDDPSLCGISLWTLSGDQIQKGPYAVPDALEFGFGSRPENTCDATFILVQPLGESQTRYTGYGIVETFVNFRLEGRNGTFYLDPAEDDPFKPTHLSACSSNRFSYILGEVKGIGDVREEIRSYSLARNWAAQGDYDAGYVAEVVPVTIESNGVEVTLLVHGKKRDGDMAALLGYIKVGDTIEAKVPTTAYDRENPSVLRDFLTCHILKKN